MALKERRTARSEQTCVMRHTGTLSSAPRARSPASRRATTSACGPPGGRVLPSLSAGLAALAAVRAAL